MFCIKVIFCSIKSSCIDAIVSSSELFPPRWAHLVSSPRVQRVAMDEGRVAAPHRGHIHAPHQTEPDRTGGRGSGGEPAAELGGIPARHLLQGKAWQTENAKFAESVFQASASIYSSHQIDYLPGVSLLGRLHTTARTTQ